jgi:hypothetical protein
LSKENSPLPDTFKKTSEDLLAEWEVKSSATANLVKFFKGYTNPLTWEISNNNSNTETHKIAGLFFNPINGEFPLCSLKAWDSKDFKRPSEDCCLTLSFYKNIESYRQMNCPELRLQVNHNKKNEIIICDQRTAANLGMIPTEFNLFINSVIEHFDLDDK